MDLNGSKRNIFYCQVWFLEGTKKHDNCLPLQWKNMSSNLWTTGWSALWVYNLHTVDGPAKSDQPPILDGWNPTNNEINHLIGAGFRWPIHSIFTRWSSPFELWVCWKRADPSFQNLPPQPPPAPSRPSIHHHSKGEQHGLAPTNFGPQLSELRSMKKHIQHWGMVQISIKNNGWMDRFLQKKHTHISYIHVHIYNYIYNMIYVIYI